MADEIGGVIHHQLKKHSDDRGDLTVLYQKNWGLDFELTQLNIVKSLENTYRGMHLHLHHKDYLLLLNGKMILGLKDLRETSETFKRFVIHEVDASNPSVCIIPPGVAHGFYFPSESLYCYGLSVPWDSTEKLGFKWDDPDSEMDWPMTNPTLSERDQDAGSINSLLTYLKDNDVKF